MAPATEQTGVSLSAASRMMARGRTLAVHRNRLILLPLSNCYSDGIGPRAFTQDTRPPLAPTRVYARGAVYSTHGCPPWLAGGGCEISMIVYLLHDRRGAFIIRAWRCLQTFWLAKLSPMPLRLE